MKYSEIEIGQSARYTKWIIPGMVEAFIAICKDDNPVHTQGKNPIVHGMLISSFISTLIGKQLPGDGAIWVSYDVRFILPVYVWDKIVIIGKVHSKDDKNKNIRLFLDVFNEKDELCVSGSAIVKVPE